MTTKKEGAAVFKWVMHILTGWGKTHGWLESTEAEVKLQELRMEKCRNCFYSKESSILKIVKGDVKHESTLSCTKCGCPCEEKTIVVGETCPMNKW